MKTQKVETIENNIVKVWINETQCFIGNRENKTLLCMESFGNEFYDIFDKGELIEVPGIERKITI